MFENGNVYICGEYLFIDKKYNNVDKLWYIIKQILNRVICQISKFISLVKMIFTSASGLGKYHFPREINLDI